MYNVLSSNTFRKELKTMIKRGYDISLLEEIVNKTNFCAVERFCDITYFITFAFFEPLTVEPSAFLSEVIFFIPK